MLAVASAVAVPAPDLKERDIVNAITQPELTLDKRVPISKPDIANVDKRVAITNPEAVPEEIDIEKRDQGSCWIHYWHGSGVWPIWYFRLDTWGEWDDDWGAGLLDNIRGKCYAWDYVWDWQFYYDEGPPPTWGHATFDISPAFATATYQCVADAVAAASWNWGSVTCQIDAAGSKWW
ncbi:hypothetical protein AA313_de0203987 [Arthrobotrys entomopaga]|nr:hypothetical protein AA313_de0203987 [Arthrobotrys entomopaga]